MDILIIAEYMGDILDPDKSNSRFMYLYKMLEKDNDVEIVTTDFVHSTKSHIQQNMVDSSKVNAILLHECGYPKNVCLKRLKSHRELAQNLENYLSKRKKPDVVYCAVPSLDVAYIAAEYCRKNNIRNILDVQDLWPEAFKMVFHVPLISDLIFMPMENKANKIYRQADQIVAVSQTYADRAMRCNTKCKVPSVVYLGTEKKIFDKYAASLRLDSDKIKIGYVGTLSHSYDIKCIIDAIKKTSRDNIEFILAGDGELRRNFEQYATDNGVRAIFTGKLDYPHMVEILTQCQIAVNPIVKGSAGSVINKVADYAMAGLPVINTQESAEYRKLLDEYKAGINCNCGDSDDVAKAIINFIDHPELRSMMSENSRKLGTERFDRETSYQQIVRLILRGGGYDNNCILRNPRQ